MVLRGLVGQMLYAEDGSMKSKYKDVEAECRCALARCIRDLAGLVLGLTVLGLTDLGLTCRQRREQGSVRLIRTALLLQVSYAEDGGAESDFEDVEAERRARVAKRAAAVPALLDDAEEDADEVERVITHRRARCCICPVTWGGASIAGCCGDGHSYTWKVKCHLRLL